MGDQQHKLADGLEGAASALSVPTATHSDPAAAGLLHYLGYDDGDAAKSDGRVRMLRAAAQFRRLFRLSAPDAPGLVFFGGEADPAVLGAASQGLPSASLAGSGLSPQKAFESCVGEGIEYLSQFVQPGDASEQGTLADYGEGLDPPARDFVAGILAHGGLEAARPLTWVPCSRLTDGAGMWFPRDLCYRRSATEQDFKPPLKLSSGCAAGPTREDATLRGLLELIERDAVALWWRGGRRGGPVAPDAVAATDALLAQLRQGGAKRKTRLLDITTDVGVPAVTAISTDADGASLALGFGARLTLVEAARAAVFELCQVELGLHVVAAKRQEAGDGALNESDRRQLRRAALDIGTCALLQPENRPCAGPAPASTLQQALERLQACDIVAYAIDLTRPQFDVPVVRVLAPGLQLDPCDVSGARLVRTIAETGGGAQHHGGLSLF